MKAIAKTRKGPGIELLDLEKPEPGKNDILIRLTAGSLCGSDVHIYEWTAGYEWMPMPLVIGHEFAGVVAGVGENIRGVSEGDRITALPSMPCGECDMCRIGRSKACSRRIVMGLNHSGAFAEHFLLKGGAEILPIPENVTDEMASMTEPLAVTLNGIDMSGIKPGETVAVFGPGPIGLFATQLLKAAGAGRIIVTGTGADGNRLEIAKEMGADEVINIDHADPVRAVLESTGKLDMVFEATGSPNTISQGLQMIKNGGRVMVVGIHSGDASFDPTDLVRRRKSIVGVYGYDRRTWLRVMRLMASGKIDIGPVITHRLPLSEAKAGFELAHNKTAAKVVFTPK